MALLTDDLKKAIYFDSYGEKEPNEIKNLLNVFNPLCQIFAVSFVWLLFTS